MQRLHHQSPSQSRHHVAISVLDNPADHKRGKKRGSYNCGRCGLPKKGHVCHLPATTTTTASSSAATPTSIDTTPMNVSSPNSGPISSSLSVVRQSYPPPRHPVSHLRRALSFDDVDSDDDPENPDHPNAEGFVDLDPHMGGLPGSCLWEVMRRLSPRELSMAAGVCKGWREMSRRVWRAAEELRLRVPAKTYVGFVASVLQKCPGLVRLSLRMESDVDSTMLACIAFSCPNLESLEVSMCSGAVNRITGDELGRFVADKRCLACLKMEGCSNLGGFSLTSSSLSILWLSDLYSLSKMVFNCPNLKEVSLEFCRQENDSTDLTIMVDALGRSCPRLQNIHIASVRLSHAVVLALTASNLRSLRMLSLVLGSEITDASVAAIVSSYSNLELLDLTGSSISDSGIGMICNVYPGTLLRLLLALCPNITSSGIQFATAQLPLLELMDCGMAICDANDQSMGSVGRPDCEIEEKSTDKLHLIYQKLIIKHNKLKKLSLWGCSGLDALYLNCPELNDLNLNSCRNLHPDRLLIQCPNLGSVHASGCQKLLVEAIKSQVNDATPSEMHFPFKRMADGSKRVRVPHFLCQQAFDADKRQCVKRRNQRRWIWEYCGVDEEQDEAQTSGIELTIDENSKRLALFISGYMVDRDLRVRVYTRLVHSANLVLPKDDMVLAEAPTK